MLTLIFQSVDAIAGASDIQLDATSLVATSVVEIHAQSSQTLDEVSLSGAATVDLAATASINLDATSLATTGATEIVASSSIGLDDVSLSASGSLALSGAASVALDDVSILASAIVITNGAANIALDNVGLVFDSTIRLPNYDSDGFSKPRRNEKERSRKKSERRLDIAIAKAIEEKTKIHIDRRPWHAAPVVPPASLVVPEFNPRLAALDNEMSRLIHEIEVIKFNRAQEEADIELLLMAM